MADKLTGKQARFVDEYIVCLNGTEAHRRAGYAGDDNVHAVEASRLLRNPKIVHAIDERLAHYAMSANEVLMHLSDIARGDIVDAVAVFGTPDLDKAAQRGKSHLVKRIRTKTINDGDTEIHETEIEMYDRLKALELLSKYHDLTNRVKVDDWHTEIVALLQSGVVTPEQIAIELGDDTLAEELFKSAGISIASS